MSEVDDVRRKRKRLKSLAKDRNTFEPHWQEIADFQAPRGLRLPKDKTNQGDDNAWGQIIDGRGLRASRVLAAGMMAGMTSPARPWFKLASPDPDMMEYKPVKVYLDTCTKMMRAVFTRSNTYRTLHATYKNLGDFGNGVATFDDDYDSLIHLTPLLTGQYYIATDSRNRVTTMYREFQMTVAQLVKKFGYSKCSRTVQNMYDRDAYDEWIDVVHALEPRMVRDPGKIDNKNMAFSSCYFEAANTQSGYLSEGGMHKFRALAARWDVAGDDAYGFGCGSEAIGHVKQLQQEQLRKAEGIDYQTKPPIAVPSSIKANQINRYPGGVSYIDAGRIDQIKSLWDVHLNLEHLLASIQDVRQAVDMSYYADLFLLLANDTRNNVTAREVAERHEEKLLMLGPVIERLHNEMLDPLIDLTFDRMQSARGSDGTPMLPPPPPELDGVDLRVEFVSTLAQAQRAVGAGSSERLVAYVGGLAQLDASAVDKLDIDQSIDNYADTVGAEASMVRSDDEVEKLRKGRQQQQQQQQLAAMAPAMLQGAQAVKTVSEIPPDQQQSMADALSAYTGFGPAQ